MTKERKLVAQLKHSVMQMQSIVNSKRRVKKTIDGMLPVKTLLTLREACSYMDLSQNHFEALIFENGLSIYTLPVRRGGKRSNAKYYLVSELTNLILDNPIVRKVR